MITSKYQELSGWLEKSIKGITIHEGLPRWEPNSLPSKPTACVHAYQIEQAIQRTATVAALNSFSVYYLVLFSHIKSFDEALRASVSQSEYVLDMQAKPPEFWQALGVPPQAALFLRTDVEIEMPRKVVPLIRHRMTVRYEPVGAFSGFVIGPNDQAITRAEVTNQTTGETCSTDRRGKFCLNAVPDSNSDFQLAITFKGRELTTVEASKTMSDQPLIINITAKEMENAYV